MTTKSKKNRGFSWGDPAEDFPTGLFDDFDGVLETVEYEEGDFGIQVHIVIRPEEYEYDARGQDYDPDSDDGLPQQWYGMGQVEGEIDEDGLGGDFNSAPQKQTRAVKFILAAREKGKVKMRDTSLKPLQGAKLHWKSKAEGWTNPDTKEKGSSDVLYPVGKYVGSAVFGQSESTRKKSRDSGRDEDDDEDDDDDEEEEEEAPTRRGRRGSSRSSGRASSRRDSSDDDEDSDDSSDSSDDDSGDDDDEITEEAAIEIIAQIVEDEGGIKRSRLGTELMKLTDDHPEELLTLAAKRSTIKAAVDAGRIVDSKGTLSLAEEE